MQKKRLADACPEADDELPPPRGVRWELSENQFDCL